MKKQAFDPRLALANALGNNGAAYVPPPRKDPAKDAAAGAGRGRGRGRGKKDDSDIVIKSKAEIEEERRQYVEQLEAQRAELWEKEKKRKMEECVGIDQAVTYVEDKDTRKPKPVDDLSEYWVTDLGVLPFLPIDNMGAENGEDDDLCDPAERIEYLEMLNGQLQQLLRMRFNIFWSQVIYDEQLRRCLDSYLRFALRSHDVPDAGQPSRDSSGSLANDISRRMLAVLARLSRPQETSHDFITPEGYSRLIRERALFDVPKLIDICAIYGDSNREVVTKIVHSVFSHEPAYKEEFAAVVQHMRDGLSQCCSPLEAAAAAGGESAGAELDIEDCLAFLPDILSCFNAIFCFFPEDCVAQLLGDDREGTSIALADLMVTLHEATLALQAVRSSDEASLTMIRKLLCRLLCCILGFHMAPRRGPEAFDELLDWLRVQDAASRTDLLKDLGLYGMENTAMEWLASGAVDDAKLDFLEQLCGPVLGSEARRRGRAKASAAGAGGASASSSRPAAKAGDTASDAAKIREVRDVVGTEYGDGFIMQCLLHYGGSVPAVVGGILDGSLPPQLKALPRGLSFKDDLTMIDTSMQHTALTVEEKQRVIARYGRMEKEATEAAEAAAAGLLNEYDDDFDDGVAGGAFRLGAGSGESSGDSASNKDDSSSDEGRPGGAKGKGKGRGKGYKGPVQGQTIQARRKEENKAKVANHNRRDRAAAKLRKGMV